jgi:hypothetical protein
VPDGASQGTDECYKSGTYGRSGLSAVEPGWRLAAWSTDRLLPNPRLSAGGVGPAGLVCPGLYGRKFSVPTLEQHLLDVAEVLEIFHRRQLFAKRSKCEYGRQELGFRGHRLSKEGVLDLLVDPHKVQSIVEWATPTSCCKVLHFTGLANYYRHFVEDYSKVVVPLTALCHQLPACQWGPCWHRLPAWNPTEQANFDALKLALSSAPMLRTFH